MNMFIKTPSYLHTMTLEDRIAYVAQLEAEIIETIKVHKTPTATSKAMGGRASRWQVIRVASRAGLWSKGKKELIREKRREGVDYSTSIYNKTSKQFKDEHAFQEHISILLVSMKYDFVSEAQLIKGIKAKADFASEIFVIEAKNNVNHNDLCTGLGQCMTYQHAFPGRKVCVVYPDDLQAGEFIEKVYAKQEVSLIPYRKLAQWLP